MQFSIVECSAVPVKYIVVMCNVPEHSLIKYSVIVLSIVEYSAVLCSDVSDRGGDPGPGRLKARLIPTVIQYSRVL